MIYTSDDAKKESFDHFDKNILSVPIWVYVVLVAFCILTAILRYCVGCNSAENIFYGVFCSLIVSLLIDLGNTRLNNNATYMLKQQYKDAFKSMCESIPLQLWNVTALRIDSYSTVEKMASILFYQDGVPYDRYEMDLSGFVYFIKSLKRTLDDYVSFCSVRRDYNKTTEYKIIQSIQNSLNAFLSHYESHKRYIDNCIAVDMIKESLCEKEQKQSEQFLGTVCKNAYESCANMHRSFSRIISLIVDLYPDLRELFDEPYVFL